MPLLLLLLILGTAAFLLKKSPNAAKNPSLGWRMGSWFFRVLLALGVGIGLFVVILLPLPNKHRLLALVPVFFAGSVLFKLLQASRKKMHKPEPDLERMKRISPRE
jgi:hypothetical protein